MFLSYMVCINVYLLARNILQIVVNYVFAGPASMAWLHSVNFTAFFLTGLCGFLAGLLIQKNSVLHAAIITVLGMLFSSLILRARLMNYMDTLTILAVGVVLGGLGGCIAWGIKKGYCSIYLK